MSEPTEETFIKQWDGEGVPMSELYEAYKEWCIGNNRPYATNSATFGKNLLAYQRYYSKKKTNKGMVYSRTTAA
jgi:phage/plasmid-associated DNA primase